MYYSVKVNWKQPKEGSDEMQKQSKSFLVYAESCTEAEGKMVSWIPANYQDSVVTDVIKTKINELKLNGDSETHWLIKVMEDGDGSAKPQPYFMVYDAEVLEDAVKKCTKDTSSDIESVSRFKTIVDGDLITAAVTVKRKVVAITPAVIEDDGDDQEESEA